MCDIAVWGGWRLETDWEFRRLSHVLVDAGLNVLCYGGLACAVRTPYERHLPSSRQGVLASADRI